MNFLTLFYLSAFMGLGYFHDINYHSNYQPNWRNNNYNHGSPDRNNNAGQTNHPPPNYGSSSSNQNINGMSNRNNNPPIFNGLSSRRNIDSSDVKMDNTRTNEQCPCVRQQGSNTCFEYDLRRQALNFEEAVVYFPDIFVDRAESLKPLSERKPNAAWCQGDSYCKDCANPFMTHLHMKGYLNENELRNEREKLGYGRNDTPYNISQHADCWKLQFSKPPNAPSTSYGFGGGQPAPSPNWTPKFTTRAAPGQTASPAQPAKDVVDVLIQRGTQFYQNQQKIRGKRQTQNATATNQTTENLGQVYQIDCINRGDVIDANGEWVSLCNICWVWRRLPSLYFPTYLNEFICSNDTKCLSGFGECKQRMRPVDLLKNFGTDTNPVWKQMTIGSSTFCECEARFGSEFHRLISS